MGKPENCLRCNSTKMMGPFKLNESSIYLGVFSSSAYFDAYVCNDCGHSEFIVKENDIDKVRKNFFGKS